MNGTMASAIYLQAASSVWPVFVVALCGVAVFLVVVLLRILPLIHKPRVTLRVYGKPTLPSARVLQKEEGWRTGSPPIIQQADRTELLQARSQWERLVEEAESNEQLTPEQRESFVDEGRKRIAEISNQLKQA
jgi:hypothetical protein